MTAPEQNGNALGFLLAVFFPVATPEHKEF